MLCPNVYFSIFSRSSLATKTLKLNKSSCICCGTFIYTGMLLKMSGKIIKPNLNMSFQKRDIRLNYTETKTKEVIEPHSSIMQCQYNDVHRLPSRSADGLGLLHRSNSYK